MRLLERIGHSVVVVAFVTYYLDLPFFATKLLASLLEDTENRKRKKQRRIKKKLGSRLEPATWPLSALGRTRSDFSDGTEYTKLSMIWLSIKLKETVFRRLRDIRSPFI